MDFRTYDKLQAQLCGVSEIFLSNVRRVLADSDADPAAKALASDLCTEISITFKSFDWYNCSVGSIRPFTEKSKGVTLNLDSNIPFGRSLKL